MTKIYGPNKTVITKETAKELKLILKSLIVKETSLEKREYYVEMFEELDGDPNYIVTCGGDL